METACAAAVPYRFHLGPGCGAAATRLRAFFADDVETNFRQRWNTHPAAQTGGHTLVLGRSTPLDPIPDASHFAQINRTFPAGVPSWTFVPQSLGEGGALAARLNAVRRARRHIHIQDQYLVMVKPDDYTALLASPNPLTFTPSDPDTMAAVLRAKLVGPDPVRVSILIPKKLIESPDFANMVLYEMRRRFITFLTHGLTDEQKRDRLLRRAAEADWPRPHHVQPYDQEHYGDELDEPGAPPRYDPLNATHEVLRTHLIDLDGRNPDDPTLDYSALLLLLQSL